MELVEIASRASAAIIAALACVWLLWSAIPRGSAIVGLVASVALAASAAAVLPPPAGIALALAFAVPLTARAIPGMLGAMLASSLALIAGVLDAPLGLAGLGAAFWVGGQTHPERAMLAFAGGALALLPRSVLTFGLRSTFLIACLTLAILFRRSSRHTTIGPGAQRLAARFAGAMPTLALLGLLLADGRAFHLPGDALLAALALAAVAVAGGALVAVAVLGGVMLFATVNEARTSWIGAACAAALGAGLLGPTAGALFLVPLALGLPIGARVALQRQAAHPPAPPQAPRDAPPRPRA